MPAKRRRGKARELDFCMMKEHFYGAGESMLAGAGYWRGDFYWRLPESVQAEIREEMREDWFRHSDRIMQAWHARDEHQLYIAREYEGDPAEPWSAREFSK